jgi:hypothetical protein
MLKGKFATSLILLLIPLLLMASQTVQSQEYTTTTTLATSTVAVGTQTLTTTQPQTRPIFSAPVTIPPTHGVCGIFFVQPFNATAGDVLTGTMTSDSKVDFYLMTDTAFQAWGRQVVAGGTCTPGSLVLSQQATTSYNFTTSIPSNGVYQLVLNNLSHSTVTAQLTVGLTVATPTIATATVYSTVTQENVLTIMQTSMQSTGGPTSGTMPLIVVALIVVILAVVVYAARKKRHHPASK